MSSMTRQRRCRRKGCSFATNRRAAWRARRCYYRARCVRHQGTARAHPSGSARSGLLQQSDRVQAVSRSAPRTKCVVPRPAVCSRPDAPPVCQQHSYRGHVPRSHRARRCAARFPSRSVLSPWPDRKTPA